jgi:ATP-binding protein involved in chromosome partitioning
MTNNKEIVALLASVGAPPVRVESSSFDGKSARAILISDDTSLIASARAKLAKGLGISADKVQIILTAEKEQPKKIASHIIAVASGKGGVGKSTIAVNLALALSRAGLRCGLLDADIYGPSTPTMLGVKEKPETQNKKLIPLEVAGIKFISLGLMVEQDQALVWRGPMVHSAVSQLLDDVIWGELDVLLIDMPPGTGDAQLTLAQKRVLTGAILVSTPQEVALADVRRADSMFRTMGVPILGLVENMAWFEDENKNKNFIFGEGGAKRFAAANRISLLGQVPLLAVLRQAGDDGKPIPLPQFDAIAKALRDTISFSA